jgi:hypothetical protein
MLRWRSDTTLPHRISRKRQHLHEIDDVIRSGTETGLKHRVQEALGHDLPASVLYRDGSVEHFAATLQTHSPSVPWSSLVAIQSNSSKLPFFCVHALSCDDGCYTELAWQLGTVQPVYWLQARGLDGIVAPLARFEATAARCIRSCGPVD